MPVLPNRSIRKWGRNQVESKLVAQILSLLSHTDGDKTRLHGDAMSDSDHPNPDTISALVRQQARLFGDRTALVDGDSYLSFVGIAERVDELARALIAVGVRRRDRVAIWAPNLWEWVVVALAVNTVGAITVPVNTRYKGPEATYLLEKSGAKVLFTVVGFLETDYVALLRETGAALPMLEHIVVLRGDAPEGTIPYVDFVARAHDTADDAAQRRAQEIEPDDVADILFTSGTTGKPKGVMSTHAQNLRVFRAWSSLVGLRETDRYLIVLPFFHSFGYKAGWLSALMRGSTSFPESVFDVDTVLERIERDRITMLPGPPALYQSLLLHPDRASYDLS